MKQEIAIRVFATVALIGSFALIAWIVVVAPKQPTYPEDVNGDGVVDLVDFSIAVDQLARIMHELGGVAAPCITQCPDAVMEIIEPDEHYEEPIMPVPLPYYPQADERASVVQ